MYRAGTRIVIAQRTTTEIECEHSKARRIALGEISEVARNSSQARQAEQRAAWSLLPG